MGVKTKWIASILEDMGKGNVPRRHTFDNLGEFAFEHEAEETLRELLNSMPHKFITQSMLLSFMAVQAGQEKWFSIFPNRET